LTAEHAIRYPTSAFEYELPAELIAQEPAGERGGSRMLVVERTGGQADRRSGGQRAALADRMFEELTQFIPAGDLLVVNSTRVRHARFIGTRASGAAAEVLLLHPGAGETWIAMGKPGSALRPGKLVDLGDGVAIETVKVLEDGHRVVRFVGADAADAIARFGRLPLPPYIRRDPAAADELRYQTVYAEREGSVAAPTAGLHFTPELLATLGAHGVMIESLDLEVGPGTFKPVEDDDPLAHPMHRERYEIPERLARAVERTRAAGRDVWAVGTTVVRALESAADSDGQLRTGPAETELLITPGYQFRVVDHLLTNFHLPRSTLLMLVSAFAGYDATMAAYRHAVAERYRFYSYGDAMLIL
jgi:S-adenosylmethionine:tRNA ribosyltransferase-isomerase